ncbi:MULTISPECIES: ion transporter [Weeksella]|uniref:Ion transport protein n=2 Tax=Bacteria TaxID=2 RepID=F0NZE4_WEEVC|nr:MULTISPECIES: ion transporter [Weeksella]ADX68291.1 Ion transport protein [Weeksella virosa DSM 16922]MDK7674754.1 ion transporter [Weeksella virosa]OFM83204.1 ion transporter [Weeksella sp. HMSC059D05]SUP54604.1 MlotiK1 channel [Weeksella virosa]VEH64072.1 MlotiK1 channel [Weeksella virosa]
MKWNIFRLKKLDKDEENKLKKKIFEIIFEANTPYGRLFDLSLLLLIILSVALVILESVPTFNARYHTFLVVSEWLITILFTIEYLLRLYSVQKPLRYVFSFYGIIDLLSILPFYFGIFFPNSKYLSSIRILRLFRILRIFNLTGLTQNRNILLRSLQQSKDRIIVFLSFVILIVVVLGSFMYAIEKNHPESGFTSIPISIYWAVVTMTTVGYGDVAPVTGLGRFLASIIMILGYGIIAVPAGIMSQEIARASKENDHIPTNTDVCRYCGDNYHLDNSIYCKTCGHLLNP